MTLVYLVRHCFSVSNNSGIFAGWLDSDVSEIGAKQLECLSEKFRNINLDAVYSSPLLRAHKTALAVNKYPKAEFITESRFKELNMGEYEGKAFADMTERQQRAWNGNFADFKTVEGETPAEVYDRVYEGFLSAIKENSGKTIAIVSHGAALRLLVCRLKGYGIDMYNNIEGILNTGVTLLEAENEGNIKFLFENDLSHLPEELKTSGWKFKK